MYSQDYPGQGGRLRGNTQNGALRTASDSIKKPPLKVDYFQIDNLGLLSRIQDTISQRDLSVDLLQDDIDHLGLGNYYAATLPVRFEFNHQRGNKLGLKSYDIYKTYLPTSIIVSPNRPVVKAYYGSRSQDGHRNINLEFSRTFARNITFGFRIFSGKSKGQFSHQTSGFNALEFNVVQRSKKDRRRSYLHFNIIRNTEFLNGGLTNPEDVLSAISGGNASYSVNNTDTDLNIKNTTFRFGTSITLGVDSLVQKWTKLAFTEIGSEKERFRHLDPDVTDENAISFSPVPLSQSIDTVRNSVWNLYQKIGFQLKSEKLEVVSGIQINQNFEQQNSLDKLTRSQFFINGRATYKVNESLSSIVSFYQELGGLAESNVSLSGSLRIRNQRFKLYLQNGSEAPGLFQTSLSILGNPVWTQTLNNQKYVNLGLHYQNLKWRTSVHIRHSSISDYVYLNSQKVYTNALNRLSVSSAEISHQWSWKFFSLQNILFFQNISDEKILSLPKISTRHDISIRIPFFKKKLRTKLGGVIWYRGNYSTPSFHSFLNDFYFEGNSISPSTLRLAPYIKADISGLEVYIGMDDLENVLRNTNRFEVNGYPQLDSRINLAFRLRLLD